GADLELGLQEFCSPFCLRLVAQFFDIKLVGTDIWRSGKDFASRRLWNLLRSFWRRRDQHFRSHGLVRVDHHHRRPCGSGDAGSIAAFRFAVRYSIHVLRLRLSTLSAASAGTYGRLSVYTAVYTGYRWRIHQLGTRQWVKDSVFPRD